MASRFSCPPQAKLWWHENSQSLCRLGEVFLSFGSGILTIISIGSPFWVDETDDGQIGHRGLWQRCLGKPSVCSSIPNVLGAEYATRAMMCLALMCGVIGWGLSMIALLIHKPKFLFPSGLAFGLQSLWLFIGLLSYTSVIRSLHGTKDWSYSVGWVGFIVSLVATIYYSLVAIYRLRHPYDGRSTAQQIYAPLSQWEEASSSDSDDNKL